MVLAEDLQQVADGRGAFEAGHDELNLAACAFLVQGVLEVGTEFFHTVLVGAEVGKARGVVQLALVRTELARDSFVQGLFRSTLGMRTKHNLVLFPRMPLLLVASAFLQRKFSYMSL